MVLGSPKEVEKPGRVIVMQLLEVGTETMRSETMEGSPGFLQWHLSPACSMGLKEGWFGA